MSFHVAPSTLIPSIKKESLSTYELSWIDIYNSNSSRDHSFYWAVDCCVAIKKASGDNNPPNQIPLLPWSLLLDNCFNCSTLFVKSLSHSAAVIDGGTIYFFQLAGTKSEFKLYAKLLIWLVDFLSPEQTSYICCKSFLTLVKSEESTLHSLSRNLNRGFLTNVPTLWRV